VIIPELALMVLELIIEEVETSPFTILVIVFTTEFKEF
jgi:hypothetical protein